jgi:hypothetical protein
VESSPVRDNAPLIPITESEASSFGECGNCHASLSGPFCSHCGEKRLSPDDYSVKHLAEEVLGEFTHFDTKFLRTLNVLFTKPGEVSRAYFHGGRSRYTKPLTLFVIINVLFFFVQPHTGLFHYSYAGYATDSEHRIAFQNHIRETGESQLAYTARFDGNLRDQKKSLLIVAVPLLALVMAVLFIGSGRAYAEHLVFSVQVYAFLLAYLAIVVLIALVPVALALRAAGPAGEPIRRILGTESTIDAIVLIGLVVYIYAGLRRAYDASRTRAGIFALILACATSFLIAAYSNVLFYATFWTT